MLLNKEAILSHISSIVELKTPIQNVDKIGIVGRYEHTSKNPGVTTYFSDIKNGELNKPLFLNEHIAFFSVLVDVAEDEFIHRESKYIIGDTKTEIIAKKRFEMGIKFDDEGNVVGFDRYNLSMFMYDREKGFEFRVDYEIDPNDPTKGLKNKKYSAWDSKSRLIQYNISDLPEAIPDEIDLGATLEMFVFGKRPLTEQPIDADMLASAATLVVPWNETHPPIAPEV